MSASRSGFSFLRSSRSALSSPRRTGTERARGLLREAKDAQPELVVADHVDEVAAARDAAPRGDVRRAAGSRTALRGRARAARSTSAVGAPRAWPTGGPFSPPTRGPEPPPQGLTRSPRVSGSRPAPSVAAFVVERPAASRVYAHPGGWTWRALAELRDFLWAEVPPEVPNRAKLSSAHMTCNSSTERTCAQQHRPSAIS